MSIIAKAIALVWVLMWSAHSTAQPLVDAQWLSSRLGLEELVVLDVRGPYARQSRADYFRAHIPGAIHSTLEKGGWRATDDNGVIGQLPPVAALATMLGEIGIGNHSHVVIVPAGGSARDTASATRIYWTLKVLGHQRVSLLDGGMHAWLAANQADERRYPLQSGLHQLPATTYRANLQTHMLVDKREVAAAAARGAALLDNRPYRYFSGDRRHRRAARSGTISGATNLPERSLTQAGSSLFKSPASLATLLAQAGAQPDAEQINFCNTGHWASMGWFVSHELLGNRQARLYDGSMLEWAADSTLPVVDGQ